MSRVKLKLNSTASAVPLVSDLVQGEVALNNADGVLYYKDNTNAIQPLVSKLVITAISSSLSNVSSTVASITGGGSVTSVSGNLSIVSSSLSNVSSTLSSLSSTVAAMTISAATGTATIDFGAFPGTNTATVAVTGQTNIQSTSVVNLSMSTTNTTFDHTATDHTYLPLFVSLSSDTPTAGTGFTITANSIYSLQGSFLVNWLWVSPSAGGSSSGGANVPTTISISRLVGG